ncbi:hypothetical protein, partial [Vibrio sp. 1641]|uniref:hypothetical protein n=1 Tax=Vibrio sp. 1641 TaxID=3074571 RepID=UPI0029643F89
SPLPLSSTRPFLFHSFPFRFTHPSLSVDHVHIDRGDFRSFYENPHKKCEKNEQVYESHGGLLIQLI